MSRGRGWRCAAFLIVGIGGCGAVFPPLPAPLFTLPLSIENTPVGSAIVDTGGAYELILRDDFGLEITGEIDVLAFGGVERVSVANRFRYDVAGLTLAADVALIGVSTCECNGIGFVFFRKTGRVLGIDFATERGTLLSASPEGDVRLPFEVPPPTLPNFDSSFLTVEVRVGEETQILRGLLDTGTNSTVMRGGLFAESGGSFLTDRLDVRISREELGTVAANVGLYETEGLPDIILGTDVMRAWGDRWYFTYQPRGGFVSIILADTQEAPSSSKARTAAGPPS